MAEEDAALEAAVAAFLGDIGIANPDRLLATLRDDHARPETPYHSWSHILHGLGLLWEYRDLIPEFDAVVLAWLNHDRIYDAQRSDNEERSAELGRTMCAEQGRAELSDRVAELILDTQHQAEPATPAGAWRLKTQTGSKTPIMFGDLDNKAGGYKALIVIDPTTASLTDTKLSEFKLKVTDKEMKQLNLQRHKTCPDWNYTIKPKTRIGK